MRKVSRFCLAAGLAFAILAPVAPLAHSLEKQASPVYRARRVALGAKLHGGVAVLFAAEEPVLDFMPYRQDEDFYYLTGWNEPGAALLIVGDAPQAQTPRAYKEILFLPTRDLRTEKYTGAKLDAVSPNVVAATGVDAVERAFLLQRSSPRGSSRTYGHSLTLPPPRRWSALPPQRLARMHLRRPATSPLSPSSCAWSRTRERLSC